jgi:MOSC domain-containing protein YiiM
MRAERLTRAPECGGRETVDALLLDERLGVCGDRRSEKDGSVSLLSSEAEREIRGLGGLCTGRFMANILTYGLDYARLREGTRLVAGECELVVTRVGKPCYEACALYAEGKPCPLPGSCAFARVLRGGVLRPMDPIRLAKERPSAADSE